MKNIDSSLMDAILNPIYDYEKTINLHNQSFESSHSYYIALSHWAIKNNFQKCLFISRMFLSQNMGDKNMAFQYLQGLSLKEINEVIDNIKGKTIIYKKYKIYDKRFGGNITKQLRKAIKYYFKTSNFDKSQTKIIKTICCRCHLKPIF